jgi:hypothetical protein
LDCVDVSFIDEFHEADTIEVLGLDLVGVAGSVQSPLSNHV